MKMNLLIVLAVIILAIEQSNYASPLIDAVKNNNLTEVQKLIKNGVDVNEKDDYGETALHFAADVGSVDIAKLLLKSGANVNAKNQNGGLTPLMVASFAMRAQILTDKAAREKMLNNEAKIVKLLLDHGALVNEKDNQGETALMYGTTTTPKIESLLIKHGADVNAKDKNGETVLINAAAAGNPEIVELLLKHGADAKAKDNDGVTAIISASLIFLGLYKNDRAAEEKRFNDATKIVKMLIEKGADVNAKGVNDVTALMFVSISGVMGIAKMLLDKKADIKAKDKFGKTALDYAKDAKRTEMIKFLEEKMATSK